jgi:RNA polymerase sigma factor (sigma-70 family)
MCRSRCRQPRTRVVSQDVMTKKGMAQLLQVLMDDYVALKRQLVRHLGSPDVADDVMQEAYLRLQRMGDVQPVQHPRTYLFRIALNIAADRRRSETRRLARSEIELLLRLEHDELDPERIAEGRSSVQLLAAALEELTPRRRAIFVAARLERIPYPEIAARFGISTRYLERELKQALDHCREKLEIKLSKKFGPGGSETSKD